MDRGRIRILLAEDMHLVRGALVALLSLEPDLHVVCEVEGGDEVVPQALKHRPHVAVIDVGLPRMDGLEAACRLHSALPECRSLILTSMGSPGMLRRAFEAKVSGFIPKDASPQDLAEAIRRVRNGHRVIDPKLAMAAWDARENPLTTREAEVLRLMAEGADVPEIATTLHLAAGTVRNYTTAVISKLNARNRLDAVRIARETGWLI